MRVKLLWWRQEAGTDRPRPRPTVTDATAAADTRARTVQVVFFTVGAVLMPLGLVAILLGWYGTAHAHYAYDQTTYLISGGVLGLGLILIGGFLYFGSWLVRVTNDQRAATRELIAALQSRPQSPAVQDELAPATPVLAGDGRTVHRRDCPLIAYRQDLHPLGEEPADEELVACRVCRPLFT